ncbi:hypothetical protein Focb16_v007914 [Fusarium oxysporum f. sp. cubense]|uniref:Uncharacterized protein n=1 Tax=Fusarium oxysporum f. sp. cubense TaxID=61366 RepID=A0A559LRG6_FUSOC|nr:hypothetical protein Focb16_v007914 [Fusarium oxysporum f. sp. cubense]
MFLKHPPGRSLTSLNSHGILYREPWRRLKLKVSRHTRQKGATTKESPTTVDSSDIKAGDGFLPAACNDLNYPWSHQTMPIILEPAFYEALDQLLHKFKYQLISSNDVHHRAHGTNSNKTNSTKRGERTGKGKNTLQDARNPGFDGGGKGGTGKGEDNGKLPPDGYRYPPSSEVQLPKIFGCPFYITNPVQYHECGNYRLRRLSDAFQHIERCHLLQEVRLCTPDSAEAARRSGNGNWTACRESNLIKIYDAICRQEFHGPHAEQSFILHRTVDGACQLRTIEETGMLLPEEFEDLKNKRDEARGSVAKWYAMWRVCFPPLNALMTTRFRTVPASPYIQAMVPPEAGRMATLQVLSAFGIQPQYCQSMSAQILNGLYPAALQGDSEVQQAVQSQQERRNSELREADDFLRSLGL